MLAAGVAGTDRVLRLRPMKHKMMTMKLLQENHGDVAVVLRLLQGDDLNATHSDAAASSSALLPGGSQVDAEAEGEPNWV